MKNVNNQEKRYIPPETGIMMPDGSFCLGVSPDTGEMLYVASEDAPEPMRWENGLLYTAFSKAHGYQDWRLPTPNELDVLYRNRDKIPALQKHNGEWNSSRKSQIYYWAMESRLITPWRKAQRDAFNKAAKPDDVLVQKWMEINGCDFAATHSAPSQRFDSGEKETEWCKVNRFSIRAVRGIKIGR